MATSQQSTSLCPHCGMLFHGPQGVRVHISRQHPAISQEMKMDIRYDRQMRGHGLISSSFTVDSRNSDAPSLPRLITRSKCLAPEAPLQSQQHQNEFSLKWMQVFTPLLSLETLDKVAFDQHCSAFSSALVVELNNLPGPKHPATKFYERRKAGRPVDAGKGFKICSNPARSRKHRSQRSRAQYDYEATQFEYYNRRKKAWRRVQKNGSEMPCKLSRTDVERHFQALYSSVNSSTRESYDPVSTPVPEFIEITAADIEEAMKGIDPGTAPGPDRVLLRPLKELKCATVLAAIASIMLKFSYVPSIYREGRTVLIHKAGDAADIGNFRPITIFPLIRRIIERALDRRIRKYLSFSTAQRGFVSTPGTYVNTSVVNAVLQGAKREKRDAVVVFLDVRKAFDNIGHDHLAATIRAQPLPENIKKLLLALLTGNTIQVEVNREKTSCIKICRGVAQGAPLSPTLFNLAIDFLLQELVEKEVSETYGFHVSEAAGFVSCVAFADDVAILAADWNSAQFLVDIVLRGLAEIGLEINNNKSQLIRFERGIRIGTINKEGAESQSGFLNTIPCLQTGESVKYLGVDFQDGIVLDKLAVLSSLNYTLNELVSSPLLKPDQKLNIINQFVWPSLVYPLQCAPLQQLTSEFLLDIDIAIRGAVKQIIQIPMDTPDNMLYSPRKFRGLGVVRASWEAYLQHYNICKKLSALQDNFLEATRDLDGEIRHSLDILNLPHESGTFLPTKHLRKELRNSAFDSWCQMPVKGKGVVQFRDYPPTNRWIINKEGLSSSQWTNAIKMTTNCAAVRGIKGRCGEQNSCRHSMFCKKIETLCHVLQDCPHGELLRNTRHHTVRDILHQHLEAQGFTVYSEVRCSDLDGRERRADLVVIDRHQLADAHNDQPGVKGFILDPTIRFETTSTQPEEVDAEKKAIYEPTVPFFRRAYKVNNWEVLGLYVGARGTITKFLEDTLKRLNLPKTILQTISSSALRSSLGILHHHLYTPAR